MSSKYRTPPPKRVDINMGERGSIAEMIKQVTEAFSEDFPSESEIACQLYGSAHNALLSRLEKCPDPHAATARAVIHAGALQAMAKWARDQIVDVHQIGGDSSEEMRERVSVALGVAVDRAAQLTSKVITATEAAIAAPPSGPEASS